MYSAPGPPSSHASSKLKLHVSSQMQEGGGEGLGGGGQGEGGSGAWLGG
jgi:hypothetical protein